MSLCAPGATEQTGLGAGSRTSLRAWGTPAGLIDCRMLRIGPASASCLTRHPVPGYERAHPPAGAVLRVARSSGLGGVAVLLRALFEDVGQVPQRVERLCRTRFNLGIADRRDVPGTLGAYEEKCYSSDGDRRPAATGTMGQHVRISRLGKSGEGLSSASRRSAPRPPGAVLRERRVEGSVSPARES